MKKILIILTLLAGLIACENRENEFADFDYTSGYFPYQYPVRTLVLGDYIYDNTNDNNHKFLISAAIGGIYENTQDRNFDVQLAPELCSKVLFESTKDTIRLMPANYYTLSSNKIKVPAGEVNGGIEVQLSDAFFDDPLAIKLGYVIPVRIIGSADVDTVLQGRTSKTNPDPRIASHWDVTPKNFTMFAVKFINPYHGKYLHRGASVVKDASNTVLETNIYRKQYVVNDEVWSLVTTGKKQVSVSGMVRSTAITGTLNMLLTFDDSGNCTVKENTGSAFTISGTGKFADDADSWGDKKRDAIHLKYQFTSNGKTYSATDTLVIRDRAVVMEVYKPLVVAK
ncbi:MAG: DUF1735 domain-containing protein [Prolixibacteraceae bacterium]|nr:DUF1735 domain-containing protein [Prolixibacteraceae bacterium]